MSCSTTACGARAVMDVPPPAYRDPATPISTEVCPYCKRVAAKYRFTTGDGLFIVTYHCAQHGDVIPTRPGPRYETL